MNLVDHALRVAAIVVVVGVGSLLARRASSHSRLFAWTVVLYIAAAMPLLSAVIPDVPMPLAFREPVIVLTGSAVGAAEPLKQVAPSIAPSPSAAALPWLLAIYLSGVSVLFIRLALGTRMTSHLLRRAEPVDAAGFMAEV